MKWIISKHYYTECDLLLAFDTREEADLTLTTIKSVIEQIKQWKYEEDYPSKPKAKPLPGSEGARLWNEYQQKLQQYKVERQKEYSKFIKTLNQPKVIIDIVEDLGDIHSGNLYNDEDIHSGNLYIDEVPELNDSIVYKTAKVAVIG